MAAERLADLTLDYHARGEEIETLLVGNHAVAALLVEYAPENVGEAKARAVYDHLERNDGDPFALDLQCYLRDWEVRASGSTAGVVAD